MKPTVTPTTPCSRLLHERTRPRSCPGPLPCCILPGPATPANGAAVSCPDLLLLGSQPQGANVWLSPRGRSCGRAQVKIRSTAVSLDRVGILIARPTAPEGWTLLYVSGASTENKTGWTARVDPLPEDGCSTNVISWPRPGPGAIAGSPLPATTGTLHAALAVLGHASYCVPALRLMSPRPAMSWDAGVGASLPIT